MALTYTLDTSTPADDSVAHPPSQGATRIRELKNAFVERFGQDHYVPASGSTYDNDDCGLHSKVTLLVQTDITEKASAIIIYGKDVSGKCELHAKDEDGNEIQITSGGALNIAGFVSGDFLMTSNTGAKAGWTDKTATWASRYIRVGATPETTGGNATHAHGGVTGSHTLTIAEIPPHTHTYTYDIAPGAADSGGSHSTYAVGTTSSTGGGGGHTHTIAAADNDPLYVDVAIYKKDQKGMHK